MKLLRLQLHNFASYRNAQVSLVDLKDIGIIGSINGSTTKSNGSGKSTLFSAITYALYGKVRGSSDETLVGNFDNKAKVVLEFEIDGNVYSITREIFVAAKGSYMSTAILMERGGSVLITEGPQKTTQSIQQILGTSLETFLVSNYFVQRGIHEFSILPDAKKKELMVEILNLSKWGKAHDKISKESTVKNKDLEQAIGKKLVLQNQLLSLDIDYLSKITTLQEEKIRIEQIGKDLTNQVNEKKSKLQSLSMISEMFEMIDKSAEEDFRKCQYKVSEWDSSLFKIEMCSAEDVEEWKQELAALNNNLSIIKETMDALAGILDEKNRVIGLLSSDTSVCPLCESHINNIHALTLRLNEDIKRTIKAHDEGLVKIKSIEKEKRALELTIKDSEQKLAREKQCRENLSQANKSLQEAEEKLKKVHQQKQELMLKHGDFSQISEAKVSIENNISILSEKLRITKSKYNEVVHQITTLELNKEQKSKLEIELVSLDAEIEKLRMETNKLGFAKKMCSSSGGVPSFLIDLMSENILSLTNEIMSKFHSGLNVVLTSQKEGKTTSAIKEVFDVEIVDKSGKRRSYFSLSGGEKSQVDLALRFALTKFMIAHGSKVDFVILDEAFGNLDTCNREVAYSILKYASENFGQIFVVSHGDNIADIMSDHIYVSNVNGQSTLE